MAFSNHVHAALRHIRRAPYQAVAAIGISTLCLFMFAAFISIAAGSAKILNFFESRPQVTAFFKDSATADEISELQKKLTASGLTTDIKFISKDDALAIYQEQNKNDPLLLEMVNANILPASLEISAKDPASLTQVANLVKAEPTVEEVIFQEDVIAILTKWVNSVRIIGSALVGSFSLLTLIVILVIIGMKIAMKRDEIDILMLVGATPWYVRTPFLLEGMIYGLFGGFFGWLFGIIAILYATPFLVDFLSGLPILPIPLTYYLLLLGIELSIGLLLGTIGSFLAVKRYLK